jgi:hypothetical protein
MNTEETNVPIPDEWYKEPSRKGVRIISICVICLAVVAVNAALLYCFPRQTKIDLTLDAVKLDEDGNEIGTAKLHITGRYVNYFILEDQLELSIDPIDGLMHIKTMDKPGLPRSLGNYTGTEYWMHSMGAYDPDANAGAFLDFFCTEEFDRFAIRLISGEQGNFWYVTSARGDYTAQEIIEYFGGIVPGK